MRIASIEDDTTQLALIQDTLEAAGHDFEGFVDSQGFLRALRSRSFDLLVVDWLLPGMSGLDLVRWVRQHSLTLPVLILTNCSDEADIVSALNAGGDDYMVKPFRRRELVARVNALLRRAYQNAGLLGEQIRVGNYLVDSETRTVTIGDTVADLSPREFDLALFLFRNLGRLIAREEIEMAVWGRVIGATSRTVDTHMSRLRVKLLPTPANGIRLTSIYSYGYRLESAMADAAA